MQIKKKIVCKIFDEPAIEVNMEEIKIAEQQLAGSNTIAKIVLRFLSLFIEL